MNFYVLITCAHLVNDYNPVDDFLKLNPDEETYSYFLRNIALRDE
ncbi:hypothetical protein YN1HA_9040 [Sulfurisphaera ohwakuensis]